MVEGVLLSPHEVVERVPLAALDGHEGNATAPAKGEEATPSLEMFIALLHFS